MIDQGDYVCFQGAKRVAAGDLAEVAVAARKAMADDPTIMVLIFDRATGRGIDLDLRGSEAELRARYALTAAKPSGRGRPKLGVVAREVTLLPRHWDWLAAQPGGASVTLRKLIETARKAEGSDMRAKTAAAYAFMMAMAGDLPGFEEASRALFACDQVRLEGLMSSWPKDVRAEVMRFLEG